MKRLAAEKACDYIENGMIIGLGTGSTVDYALRKIGKMVNEGIKIKGIPTSFRTKKIAIEEKIPLTSLDDNPEIDITIDGADEVDSELRLIKGGGGALTREKMIAYYSKKVIIIIDETKVVKMLGIDFSLPVEVVKFGWTLTKNKLKEFNCNVELRKIMNNPYITDNSNYIIDCEFDRIKDPEQLEIDINNIPGVVENGLFIGLADEIIVGSKQGIKTLS
ncbi:MAG: ribose-5-phosphate isomerase RpiA [Thermoplasmatales archaeon]|nr:ribose-5-phosphate isomerase RpiA [Thermoplasmatales archaeon]